MSFLFKFDALLHHIDRMNFHHVHTVFISYFLILPNVGINVFADAQFAGLTVNVLCYFGLFFSNFGHLSRDSRKKEHLQISYPILHCLCMYSSSNFHL
ncbi:hypothetical protein PMAYCL1PPCAC_10871 [Pristionchus mayeri]|uniref:Uncharacterized protein n=1 Tax=Pristionchus mayeri TaxID=1317129 RepID=A0AAN4ZKH7_9BILA|nr:hypothetical protein PMAYCL1PPCAC_10863 [Pristionchus mayeri]GMR40670.1 hypothetical protein PMAYCL1PPCAC_10865 [Pristionchus mayeri]GMR40676.1 hypothetical protein PMAYCL1PPCAC_10871 [Pristionchus mayeri]